MTQEPNLDDSYTSGVYYDREAGEYCGIVEVNDTIGLTEPESDEVYWTFYMSDLTKEEIIEVINRDFIKVSERAVENPVHVVSCALDVLDNSHTRNELVDPEQESIDLGYARKQVTITEE